MLAGPAFRVDARIPGLAVDPGSDRAFVVAGGVAAQIDLRTLAVSIHELGREASFLSRLWSWLDPAALAKEYSGEVREARWLGDGLLAVSGSDAQSGLMRPAGLVVVDTRTWNIQTIDPGATSVSLTDDAFVATPGALRTEPGGTRVSASSSTASTARADSACSKAVRSGRRSSGYART
jgi:hypothetical protein